jgi:hypothetical protein
VAVDRAPLRDDEGKKFEVAQLGADDTVTNCLLAVGIEAGCLDRGGAISSPVPEFWTGQSAGGAVETTFQ